MDSGILPALGVLDKEGKPTARLDSAAVTVANQILVFGGRDNSGLADNKVWSCDPAGEVQKAINMFLGIAQAGAPVPPDCSVDCNGDGMVSIGEVQKVINGFLGLPSSC